MQRCTGKGGEGGAGAGGPRSSCGTAAEAVGRSGARCPSRARGPCGSSQARPNLSTTARGAKPSGKCSPQLGHEGAASSCSDELTHAPDTQQIPNHLGSRACRIAQLSHSPLATRVVVKPPQSSSSRCEVQILVKFYPIIVKQLPHCFSWRSKIGVWGVFRG